MRSLLLRCLGVLLLAIPCARAATLRHEVLDDFSNVSAWQASASDQVHASLRRDTDGSLCLDYDFAGVSGYAVMRRALPVHWPEAFDLHASLKRSGGVNDLQIKFVDASGDNVWWIHRPNAALPTTLSSFTFRPRHVEFAWGPTADRRLRETQFIELVVVAGRDRGRGSLCAARLALDERAPDPAQWPAPRTRRSAHRLDLDFGASREFNGVALRWPVSARPLDYDLLASDDERHWRTLRRVRGSDGGLDTLFLPDSEARHLRVAVLRGAGLPQLTLRSAAEWPTLDAMLATQAAAAPRGDLPRAYRGEQNYWTLVGVDGGGAHSALMSEDGAIEVGRGGFSVEPVVLLDDGSRVTWADATLAQTLREGYLPLPAVHWQHPAFQLEIEAAADGDRAHPELLARYTLRNTGPRERRFTLLLAVRPWQVNPPQQFLGTPGGTSPIRDLAWDGRTLTVNT
ncbi:MAG TPA: discoidin domain-containing protein, partial [Albitalea sp.]|nr:discoidin domain-containing protein [Albitalea sp.]